MGKSLVYKSFPVTPESSIEVILIELPSFSSVKIHGNSKWAWLVSSEESWGSAFFLRLLRRVPSETILFSPYCSRARGVNVWFMVWGIARNFRVHGRCNRPCVVLFLLRFGISAQTPRLWPARRRRSNPWRSVHSSLSGFGIPIRQRPGG